MSPGQVRPDRLPYELGLTVGSPGDGTRAVHVLLETHGGKVNQRQWEGLRQNKANLLLPTSPVTGAGLELV